MITENTDHHDINYTTDDLDVLSNDPSTFCMLPCLSQDIIEFLIKKGPMQSTQSDLPQNQSFPKNKYGRSFQSAWYWKSIPGNIQVKRDWLCYSIKDDSAFCLHCIIFGKNSKQSWTKIGFKTWPRAIYSIQHHECSESHIEASLKFKLRKSSLPVIPLLREKVNHEKATIREIVRCLIDIALFLSENNIAFRGHRESFKKKTTNQGNFINLALVISKYSPCLSAYI